MKDEQMTVNPITLSFEGDQQNMEDDFQSSYFNSYIKQVRISLVLALIIICGFGIIDQIHVPGKHHTLWFVRYGLISPLFILVIWLSYRDIYRNYMHAILATLESLTGIGVVFLMWIAGPTSGEYPSIYISPANMMLILFFGYLLGKIRFIYAAIAGFIILVAYNLLLITFFGFGSKMYLTYNIYLGLFNLLGMFACYYLELYERKSFYLLRLLDEEKENVNKAKKSIEKVVNEQTEMVRKKAKEVRYREKDMLEAQRLGRISSWSHDLVSGEVYWSEEFYRMAGLKDRKPSIELFYSLLAEDEGKRFKKELAGTTREQNERETRLMLSRPDGEIRYFHVRWKSLFDEKGNEIKRFGTDQDITEQVLAEEQLESARKMEALGFMAGSVAHELNNALVGLVSYPELLLKKIGHIDEFRTIAETIYDSGKRAAAIVSDLLTMARSVTMVKKTLNINHIILEYLRSHEGSALRERFPKVTISTVLGPDIDNIKCSRTHISKCLVNLVVNGAEAVDGKGEVVISTRNRSVGESVQAKTHVEKGEYVILSVADTGHGIPEKIKEQVFHPYFTNKDPGKSGTGLGLAIVSTIVDKHNGAIALDTSKHGTRIEVYLPSTKEGVEQDSDQDSGEYFYGSGEKVFVIDDDPVQRYIARELLLMMDYEVDVAGSGEEAVEYLQSRSVDLVLLDMFFETGMGGRDIFDEIIKLHPRQKVIIVSGFSKSKDVEYIQEHGAGQYIRKPYSINELGRAIYRALYQSYTTSSKHQ